MLTPTRWSSTWYSQLSLWHLQINEKILLMISRQEILWVRTWCRDIWPDHWLAVRRYRCLWVVQALCNPVSNTRPSLPNTFRKYCTEYLQITSGASSTKRWFALEYRSSRTLNVSCNFEDVSKNPEISESHFLWHVICNRYNCWDPSLDLVHWNTSSNLTSALF